MQGLDTLRTSMRDRAHARRRKALAEAEAEAARILQQADQRIADLEADWHRERESLRESEGRRSEAMAALDQRRTLLAEKQALIEEVLEEAQTFLQQLEGEQLESYYRRLLEGASQQLEAVRCAAQDESLVRALVQKLGLKAEIETDAQMGRGLILLAPKSLEDYSFRRSLANRHDELMEVAAGLLYQD